MLRCNPMRWTIALLLVTICTGCAPFIQHRTQYELCINPTPVPLPGCETHALQQFSTADGASYLLGFIELDDQGQLWDRKQMHSVMNKLLPESGENDLLMAVFVHGWKHSAAPNDGNIKTFRKVLAGLSEGELHISQKNNRPARKVVGIYIGWRGGSVTVPFAEDLTFWERKNTAQKVGRGGVTEVLSQLESLKRAKDSQQKDKEASERKEENDCEQKNKRVSEEKNMRSGTRLVIVGHSFGGAIVYSSLVQILQSRFVQTTGPDGTSSDAEHFGNLVVLINPAVEALQFAPLSDMSTEQGYYFEQQLPILAVLTSEADNATRYAFPVGRNMSTLFENDRYIKRTNRASGREEIEIIHEGQANVTAIGHFYPYQTHKLYPSSEVTQETAALLSSSESVRSACAVRRAWEKDHSGSRIPIAGLMLERTATSAGRNPYLVIKVDKRLITGHNNIDGDHIIEFLKQFILMSTLP